MFLLILGFAGNGGYLTSLPRSLRISWRRRNPLRASMVALTTLAWLLEPSDLARTSLMPAASTTALTPPPAMTTVPGEAGRKRTRPPPNSPITSCGMVFSKTATATIDFRADSDALRIASETSFALPKPYPTRPLWSPATISALKLKRRPPLTTFAQRLMNTTFSVVSPFCPPDELSLRRFLPSVAIYIFAVDGVVAVHQFR